MTILKIIFLVITVLHGLIFLMGFVKGFKLAEIKDVKSDISQTGGLLWLLTTFLFLITAVLFLLNMEPVWWILAIVSVVYSQILTFMYWKDAKFGTIANVLIIAGIILFAFYKF